MLHLNSQMLANELTKATQSLTCGKDSMQYVSLKSPFLTKQSKSNVNLYEMLTIF